MTQLRLSSPVLALSLAVLLSIFALSHARQFYCVSHTQQILSLRLHDSVRPKVNLCTYPRDEAGSAHRRTCHWELKISQDDHPAQLALELFFTVRYQRYSFLETQAKAKSFLDTMKVVANQSTCFGTFTGWNSELHFQLFAIRNNSYSVFVIFELDTAEKLNISDLFYPRVSYSNLHGCSGDLVHYNGRCYGVRLADRLSQAARFHSEADARGFLAAYRRAVAMAGSTVSPLSSPARLAMTRCNDSHRLMMAWHRDNNDCILVSIPINRTQPGSGDCVSIREDPESGEPVFQPVSCQGPMLTLLTFQSAPQLLGDCSGERPAARLLPNKRCCRRGSDAKPANAQPASLPWLPLLCIFALSIVTAAVLAYRYRHRILGILHSHEPHSSKCHQPEGQKLNNKEETQVDGSDGNSY